jgi:hypothetical protein
MPGGSRHELRSHDFVLDVHPAGLAPGFRGTTGWMSSAGVEHLRPGDVVAVRFNAKTTAVRLERSRNFDKPVAALADESVDEVAGIADLQSVMTLPAARSVPSEAVAVESLSVAEILAAGVPARVIVVESEVLSPPMNDKAGHPFYRFALTVIQDGVDPFRNEEAQGVPPYALPLTHPGANLPAKVATGEHVVIDWEAAQREASTARP